MDSTQIFNGIISLLSIILTAFLIPWLKAKAGTEKVKQGATEFSTWTAFAEKAAYQLFSTNYERKA